MKGERCDAGTAGEECRAGEAGGENGLEAVGGLNNVSGTDEGPGERSGAGRSLLVSRAGHARMTGVFLAGSDRLTAHTWMAATEAVCSTSPSWAELWPGGDGAMQKGVRTGGSLTRSLLAWGPGSGPGASQGGEGWTGAESGSRLGSWSAQPVAGAGGEGVRGREAASGEPQAEADRGHSSGRAPHSGGSRALRYSTSGRVGYSRNRQGEVRKVHGLTRRDEDTAGCAGLQNGRRLPVRSPRGTRDTASRCTSRSCCRNSRCSRCRIPSRLNPWSPAAGPRRWRSGSLGSVWTRGSSQSRRALPSSSSSPETHSEGKGHSLRLAEREESPLWTVGPGEG